LYSDEARCATAGRSRAKTANTVMPLPAQRWAERQSRLSDIEARLKLMEAAPSVINLEIRRLENEARQRVADLHGFLSNDPHDARKVVG
jgi:hypothetical protein